MAVTDAAAVAELTTQLRYPVEESDYEIEGRYPNLAAWRERMRELPGWGSPYDIMPGQRVAPKW